VRFVDSMMNAIAIDSVVRFFKLSLDVFEKKSRGQ
jgi:hypothetical protein